MSYPRQEFVAAPDVGPSHPMYNGLFYAIDQCNVNMCMDIVAKDPKTLQMIGWNDMTPLHHICLKGKTDIVQMFLDNGAEVDARSSFGETPLHYACRRGTIDVIHMLISSRADCTAVDKQGRGCMHFAAMGGSIAAMHYLATQTQLNYDVVDNNGDSPLHVCCFQRHNVMIDYLLRKSRCDPRHANHKGTTPLHTVVKLGNSDIVWKLVKAGGCGVVHAKDQEGNTPINIAKQEVTDRHTHIVKELEYYAKQPPRLPPKGPVMTWYTLLFLPFTWAAITFILSLCLNGNGGYFSLLMFILLVAFVGRQSHRLHHPSKWPNPVFLGAFAGGIFHCIISSSIFIMYFWPCVFTFFYITSLSISCLYHLYYLTRGDPGVLTHNSRERNVELTVLDIALGHCKEGDFCPYTELIKTKRSKYCRLCEKLVEDLDHHCLFLMNCIARNNHRAFVIFIINVMVLQFSFCYLTLGYMWTAYPNSENWLLIDMLTYESMILDLNILCIFAFLWECQLIGSQLVNIAMGQTTYYQSHGTKPNLSSMLRNLAQFFFHRSEKHRSLKVNSPLLL
ncbi:zinc finger protein [Ciona intestinalis]